MRIAFDLDDTLIPSHPLAFAVERPRGFLGRLFATEHLRHGAIDLLHALRRRDCDVWVSTTSLRRPGGGASIHRPTAREVLDGRAWR
jgi:hypothetical protein